MIRNYMKFIESLFVYATVTVLVSLSYSNLVHAQEVMASNGKIQDQSQYQNSSALLLINSLYLNSLHDHFYSGFKLAQLWTKCNGTRASNVEQDQGMCAIFSVSRYFNFIDVSNFLSLGIHLGLSSIREVYGNNSNSLWHRQTKLYAGIQGLIDNDAMFLGLKFTNYTDYTGVFDVISGIVTTGQFPLHQNWALILSSGVNLLQDSNRFLGPTTSMVSYGIDFNDNLLKSTRNNFQMGLLYANSTHVDNSTWLGFYRLYLNTELKQTPIVSIFSTIKSIYNHTDSLHINFGGDWVVQTKLADLMLSIGYNSSLIEYKNIQENFLRNLSLKASLTLRLF